MRTSRPSLSFSLVAALAVVAHMAAQSQTDPKVDEVLKAARAAMGGEVALAKVQSATVTGSARRVMGEREMTSEVTLDLLLPDKYKRTEDMGFAGGPSFTRVSAVNGSETWDDATNRGGGAFRFGGPGGPGGPGAVQGQGQGQGQGQFTEEDRQRFRDMQAKRMRGELARYALIWFLKSDAPMTYSGVAEAPDGKADVIEVKPEGAAPMKLFVDQETHKPLMLTYDGVLPRMLFRGGGQGGQNAQRPTPEEIEKMRKEPPQQVTYEVHFSEYKKVDGVLLPHLITQGANGKVTEEFTIEKYKLNAPLKPEQFVKKGS
jgi:hypothetical protein